MDYLVIFFIAVMAFQLVLVCDSFRTYRRMKVTQKEVMKSKAKLESIMKIKNKLELHGGNAGCLSEEEVETLFQHAKMINCDCGNCPTITSVEDLKALISGSKKSDHEVKIH